MDESQSILSHGEREIAAMLRAGRSVEEIAAERDDPIPVVEKAVDRIRDKTRRALVTLLQSPHTDAVAADLDAEERSRLRASVDPVE